jgi:phosphoribosylanthranilate isomerase
MWKVEGGIRKTAPGAGRQLQNPCPRASRRGNEILNSQFAIRNSQFLTGESPMLVKICGLTRPDDARAAINAGADLLGFVLVPGTPRAVDPASAPWIRELGGAATVGVFRDVSLEEIRAARDELGLDWVQLHGREPDGLIDALGPRVIRRVDPRRDGIWERVVELADRCVPLLDPGAGSGVAVDWSELPRPPEGVRFGIAGGLTPDTVADAVRWMKPTLVDVASGVEASPGMKDSAAIRAFILNARTAVDTL